MDNIEKITDFLKTSRKTDKEKKLEKMSKSFNDPIFNTILSMYGVSPCVLNAYYDKYGKYPPFIIMETEERTNIKNELKLLDRLLKITKIKEKLIN